LTRIVSRITVGRVSREGVRQYHSPLRGAQQQQTRERILEAAIGHIADEGLAELTVPLVAERAGVSLRTVYRHFPTKDELIDSIGEFRDARFGVSGPPRSVEELVETTPALFEGFAARDDLVRAADVSAAGRQIHDRARRRRAKALSRIFEDVTRELTHEEGRRVVAAVQVLWSTRAWLTMHDNWGMDGREAGATAQWAIATLVAQARGEAEMRSNHRPPPAAA
jgi:AcrR family transcriptional regulator